MSSGWGCNYLSGSWCKLLDKECDPGDKGCVLYGKVVFSDPSTASNEAVERRAKKKKRTRKDG